MPIVAVPLAMMLDVWSAYLGRYRLWLAAIGVATFPFISMSIFGKSAKYNLVPLVNQYGIQTYSQPTYHKDLIFDLFANFEWTILQVIDKSAFSSRWSSMSTSEVLQRVCLYIGPPALALLVWCFVTRIRGKNGDLTQPV